jgi:hypothetical protein
MAFEMLLPSATKILITGNGFDLALGLPTAYPDFIDALKEIKLSKDGNIDCTTLLKDKTDKLKNNYNLKSKYDLTTIKNHPGFDKNPWVNYFSSINKNRHDRWVDFEKEIFVILNDLKHLQLQILEVEEKTNENHGRIISGSKANSSSTGVYIHENSFERLSKILNWPTGMKFVDLRTQRQSTTTDILIHLQAELKIFIDFFSIYLKNFVMEIFHSRKFKSISIKPDIVVTFNYTNVTHILGFPTEYLHGSLQNNDLILGINSVEEVIESLGTNSLSFTKYYQTIAKKTFASHFKYSLKNNTNKHQHYLFYGHSFDISDKAYIKEIFESTQKYQHKITIYFHTEESKLSIIKNLLDPRMLGQESHLKVEQLIATNQLRFELMKDIIV